VIKPAEVKPVEKKTISFEIKEEPAKPLAKAKSDNPFGKKDDNPFGKKEEKPALGVEKKKSTEPLGKKDDNPFGKKEEAMEPVKRGGPAKKSKLVGFA